MWRSWTSGIQSRRSSIYHQSTALCRPFKRAKSSALPTRRSVWRPCALHASWRLIGSPPSQDLYLYYFLLRYPGRSLIFFGSIDGIRRAIPLLELLKFPIFPLHSQLQQKQRLKNLDRFVMCRHRRLWFSADALPAASSPLRTGSCSPQTSLHVAWTSLRWTTSSITSCRARQTSMFIGVDGRHARKRLASVCSSAARRRRRSSVPS